MQVKHQFEVDKRETRIKEIAAIEKKMPDRAVSMENNRRSSTLVPPLDLSKVKGYEDHLRDKMAAKNKDKSLSIQDASNVKQSYTNAATSKDANVSNYKKSYNNNKASGSRAYSGIGGIERSSSGPHGSSGPSKAAM